MSVRLLKDPFTVDAYHRLAQVGILGEDDRVELLDGQREEAQGTDLPVSRRARSRRGRWQSCGRPAAAFVEMMSSMP